MSRSRILKWVTGALEIVLAVPVVGISIVLGSNYIVLPFMFVFHLITLILTIKDRGAKTGSIVGMVSSCIAWLPIVAIAPHILAAFFLFVNATMPDEPSTNQSKKQSPF